MTVRRLVLLAAALVVLGAAGLAARPQDATPDARVERLASELRCPVCQGQSIADSPSQTAVEMRALIAERIAQGRSDDEIRDEFRRSYGDWVFLTPDARGVGVLAWLVPIVALIAGATVAAALVRRRSAEARAT